MDQDKLAGSKTFGEVQITTVHILLPQKTVKLWDDSHFGEITEELFRLVLDGKIIID